MAASVMPTSTRLITMAPSESSHSGAVPSRAYSTVATTSSRTRPRRSTMTPAKGASRASASAGTVRTTGTRVFAPGTAAKWSCIFGRTGAIRTAPSTGRQLPAIRSRARSGPALSVFGWALRVGAGTTISQPASPFRTTALTDDGQEGGPCLRLRQGSSSGGAAVTGPSAKPHPGTFRGSRFCGCGGRAGSCGGHRRAGWTEPTPAAGSICRSGLPGPSTTRRGRAFRTSG